MTDKKNDITEMHYAKWLEGTLRDMSNLPVRGIAFLAVTDNGDVYTNYYNVSMIDKFTMAGLIQQDSTLDMLSANGIIKQDEDGDDEEDEHGDEEE